MIAQTAEPEVLARRLPVAALVPGVLLSALFVDWVVQDGGYDPSTWYWGALLLLSGLAIVTLAPGRRPAALSRPARVALAAFALYVAWSYLSIAWAASPGDALQGSNRALLYLLVFLLVVQLPWTAETVLASLLVFVLGVGAVAFLFLARFSSADHVAGLFVNGRMQAPAGYFNANAAVFTMTALAAVAIAAQRSLTPPLRGVLLGVAAASLQLAVCAESRGWLFTLPVVVVVALGLVRDRARFVLAAILPVAAAVVCVHRLVGLYDARAGGPALTHAAMQAGNLALITCGAVIVLGTLLASADVLLRPPARLLRHRRAIGATALALVLVAGIAGASAATHGHPIAFLKRQWNGFSHTEEASAAGSRFAVVGSGRYDFWRVALDAFEAHPLGGLGQDNYADYYVSHRRTTEEPAWPHSLEMRLLAMTGIVGFALFATFLVAAVIAAWGRRRAGPLGAWAVGAALLPLDVWLIHGSVDWFWEMPCLAGPAFAFLAMAGSLTAGADAVAVPAATGGPDGGAAAERRPRAAESPRRRRALPRPVAVGAVAGGLLAASLALAFPYLSVVETARAAKESSNPVLALRDLSTAASLDPLSALPARDAGDIALQTQQYEVAQTRFRQAIAREPGGWFAWFGAGLAASELGETARARRDFEVAHSINDLQPPVREALARVGTANPLTAAQALEMLVIVQ